MMPAQPADRSRKTRCGRVAIVGRPNVGKSTLLNCILGVKISITSRRPQTTRRRILGIKTCDEVQAIYLDTPGFHHAAARPANRRMNQAVAAALEGVHAIVLVSEGLQWHAEDEQVLERAREQTGTPLLLAINKVDTLAQRELLLPRLRSLAQREIFDEMVPLSARRGDNVERLEECILRHMPPGAHEFPPDSRTDGDEKFLAAEMVREKIVRQLGDELPYVAVVEVEHMAEQEGMLHIHARIRVEREGQKVILIGRGGRRIKSIGTAARHDMEELFGLRVMLHLRVHADLARNAEVGV